MPRFDGDAVVGEFTRLHFIPDQFVLRLSLNKSIHNLLSGPLVMKFPHGEFRLMIGEGFALY